MTSLFSKATNIRQHEIAAALLSLFFVFSLMFAYNIMKPVRDAMAPDWSDTETAWLWTYNFGVSLVAVSLYGFAVSRTRLKVLIPGVYAFFAASFVLFYLAASTVEDTTLVDKSFFLWISVFSLFHISVFWSLMSDLFTKQQAPRLFAFIASGASIGTIAGSSATLLLATVVGTLNLMLVAALILVAIVPIVGVLYRLKSTLLATDGEPVTSDAMVSGNPLAGFRDFVRNPFLLGIALFIFLYTSIGSFAWFEIKNMLEPFERDERAQIWAAINLTVNVLAIATAILATGRIAERFGLAKTLALVPVAVAAGFAVLVVNPTLAIVIAAWIVLKSGNYAITRPGREMLYTLVSREQRFKAKPVIDIVVYRGGDALAGWSFAGLTAGLGLGLGGVAAVGVVIAVIWAMVGVYLGRKYEGEK